MSTWLWGNDLKDLFESQDLRWKLVDRITPEELGSSPGDVMWDGRVLHIERTCPEEWVMHELAHYLVCQAETPHLLRQKNWGLVTNPSSDTLEDIACDVNILLAILLNRDYWQSLMRDLSVLPSYWRPKVGCPHHTQPNESEWAEIRATILEKMSHYRNRFTLSPQFV